MKKSKGLSVFICMAFVGLLLLPGLGRNVWGQEKEKTKVEDQSKETSSTKEKFSQEKKEFNMKARARLDELNKKINELEADLKKAGSKVKAEAKEGLQELKEKRVALRKEMRKLKAKSREKWEEAKQKVQSAGDDLEQSYNKVRDKVKSE